MAKHSKNVPFAVAARFVRSLAFPPYCVSCRRTLPWNESAAKEFSGDAMRVPACFCAECVSDFAESVRAACPVCGESYAFCECVPDALRFAGAERAYSCFAYDKTKRKSASSALIFKLKDGKNSDVVRFCAVLLARRLEKAALVSGIDLGTYTLTYAPRRRRAVRENGSDHMQKMAKLTAKLLGLPFEPVFVNTAHTAQKKKDAASRLDAAESSIKVKRRAADSVFGKRYIVLDDILTSGATLGACVSRLYEYGARDVIAATLAKTKST